MKDAYYSVPLHYSSRNYVRFLWSGNLYEFLCLCFDLELASRIFCTGEDKYSDSNISGPHAYNRSKDGRNSHVQRQCNLPPATFRFCFKPEEVHFKSSSENRVPWDNNKFFEDVSVFATRGVKNSESMSGYSYQKSRDSSQTNKILSQQSRQFCQLTLIFGIFSNSK